MFTAKNITFPCVFEGYEHLLCELQYFTGSRGNHNFTYKYYNPNLEFGEQTLFFIRMYDGRWAVTLGGEFKFAQAFTLFGDHIIDRRETKTYVGNNSKFNSQHSEMIAYFEEAEIPKLMERFVNLK